MNYHTQALNVSKFGVTRTVDSPFLGKITNGRRYEIFDQVQSDRD